MTFTAKKWFFFFVFAILLCISYSICCVQMTGQNKMFRIPLSLTTEHEKISQQNEQVLLYTNFSKEKALLPILDDKINHQRLLEIQFADFIQKYNSLPKGSEFYIGEDLYNFLSNFVAYSPPIGKELRSSSDGGEYQFASITECSVAQKDINLIGCIPFFPNYFTLSTANISGEKSYSLKKIADLHLLVSNEDLDFTLATYQTSILNDLFTAQNIFLYVISYHGVVLVESKDQHISWPIQYDNTSKDLYYLYNEFIYLPQGFHTPSEFVGQKVNYGSRLSIIDSSSSYNKVKGVRSLPISPTQQTEIN